ncbi:MAG: hypothetical protein KatS3mg061_0627 [Dehalococcoidia bacterium]|nr:MAG: hypothetical protein KatS3mg061_0627 [Dehalococcoidia bacterium]
MALGARGTTELTQFVAALDRPRHIWLMTPVAAVDPLLEQLVPLLEADDTVIDGGELALPRRHPASPLARSPGDPFMSIVE